MLKSFIPEIFFSFCILIQLIFNIKIIVNLKYNYPLIEKETLIQSIVILTCIFFLFLNLKMSILTVDYFLVTDFTISFIKSVILLFSISSICLFYKTFNIQKLSFFEFFTLFLISILSSLLMVSSNDFIMFYLSLEMQSLCFYVLSGFKRDSIFSSESGLKYYISGSLISTIFLLGCVLIYFCIGTLSLQNIEMLLFMPIKDSLEILLSLGILFILITFFFKIGAAPFYFFYPDIYEGSPLFSTIILSTVPQLSMYFFIYKFLICLGDNYSFFKIVLDFCGCLSLLVGTLYSISQKRIKRLFLYSSIAQTGFLLCCLSIGTFSSFVVLYFYLILYLIISLLIWSCLSIFFFYEHSYNSFLKKVNQPLFISNLINIFKLNYIWSISFLVVFFSIGGIPPFGGFFSKLFVFLELAYMNKFIVAFVLIFLSSISVFYYIRIIKIIYFEPSIIDNSNTDFFFIPLTNNTNLFNLIFSTLFFFVIIFLFFIDNFFLFLSCNLFI